MKFPGSICLYLALCATAILTGGSSAQANDGTAAASFEKLKLSLAVILSSHGTGTGFCVHSDANESVYLTNAHVVGADQVVTVFRQYPQFTEMKGTVLAKGISEEPDLALIEVHTGNIAPAFFSATTPREGDPIANAGYPSAQYTLAKLTGSLVPSIHLGTISAIENRGGLIEYDAQTLPGNSGGPVFDPSTGAVVGVVQAKLLGSTDANLAIGIGRVVLPFLERNNVTVATVESPRAGLISINPSQSETSIIKTLPGADSVAVLYDTSHVYGAVPPDAIANSATDFATKFSSAFHVRAFAVAYTFSNANEIAQGARDHGALLAIPYGCSFRNTSSFTNAYGTYRKWTFSLSTVLIDSFGTHWYGSGKIEKEVSSARDIDSAIISSYSDLNDKAIEALTKEFALFDESAQANLFRYALPISNGGKKAFFNLIPAANGATAKITAPFGIAAEAGLQNDDLVLQLNGITTAGKSQDELKQMLLSASSAGPYDLLIEAADGKQQHIKFEAKDLRYYLERRSQSSSSS